MNNLKELNEILEIVTIVRVVAKAKRAYDEPKEKSKRIWTRELYLERDMSGFFVSSYQFLKDKDPERFRVATRMRPEIFDNLLNLLFPQLKKFSSRAISPDFRLFLTLIYLAHGTSRQSLSLCFKLSVEAVRRIVAETSRIIWETLSPIYLSLPKSYEWQRLAADFGKTWAMPNCVGAIHGKYVPLTCPSRTRSKFSNYEGAYNIVLLAVCDANYTFTAVDIGAPGNQSDGSNSSHSEFGKRLHNGNLDLPKDSTLPNSDISFPYYLVGDTAFPLKPYLMRPYPGKLLTAEKENFNGRLSRARRTIENAFGILTGRWRILHGPLNMAPDTADKIVCATVVLHNFLKKTDGTYCPPDYVDREENGEMQQGLWRKETNQLKNISRFSSNNSTKRSFHLRDILNGYLYENKIT